MPKTEFALMTCGYCPCGATAFSARIEGDGGGLRITDSSLGIWRDVEAIEPGDPRYRDCLNALENNRDYHPKAVRRYTGRLPQVTDLDAREKAWLSAFDEAPLSQLGLEWGAYCRLSQAGVKTCGAVARHTQASMKRDLPGVGMATAMEVARAFGRKRLSWSYVREALAG
jgi:hypothetical protein